MRFTNVGQLLKEEKIQVVKCAIDSPVWAKFGRIKDDEIHNDYVYCLKCFAPYKVHDKKGILSSFQPLLYKFFISLGKVTCLTSLKNHITNCESEKTAPIVRYAKFLPKDCHVNPKDLEQMKYLEAKFVSGTISSFLLVENQHFMNLLQFCIELGAKYGALDIAAVAFSRQVIKNVISESVAEIKSKIKELFKSDCSFCLTADIWTDSVNHNSFMDITAFYLDENFDLRHVLIAFRYSLFHLRLQHFLLI